MKNILMQLAGVLEQIPRVGETDGNSVAWAKISIVGLNWTWYIAELDIEDGYCFGCVDALEVEMGYFSLQEIADTAPLIGPFGSFVVRDLTFEPEPLEALTNRVIQERYIDSDEDDSGPDRIGILIIE